MNTGRVVLGSGFLAVGTLVLLERADVLDAGEVIADWWPVLFLVAALLDVLSRPPRVASATVLGGLGLVLLAVTNDLVEANVWEIVWPVVLVGLGLWLLLRRPSAVDRDATRDETIGVVALFSGRRVVATAPRFRGGTATAVFGGVEIDLTETRIEGETVLDTVALFGGVDVEVPPGWRVVIDGPAIFGGSESHVPPPITPDAPTLRVRATAIFGGVDVKLGSAAPSATPAPAVHA